MCLYGCLSPLPASLKRHLQFPLRVQDEAANHKPQSSRFVAGTAAAFCGVCVCVCGRPWNIALSHCAKVCHKVATEDFTMQLKLDSLQMLLLRAFAHIPHDPKLIPELYLKISRQMQPQTLSESCYAFQLPAFTDGSSRLGLKNQNLCLPA